MEQDALRRDLTINGMFYDVEKEQIIDFVNGQYDLDNHIIQFIGDAKERIVEDHLRILRALRFSLRFGFEIETNSLNMIKKYAPLLKKISKERIRDELVSIFSNGKFEKSLNLLSNTDVLRYVLPEVAYYNKCEQHPVYHPEGAIVNKITYLD